MGVYQRGENWYIDFTFKGQRIRESAGPSRKLAEDLLGKRKVEIRENKFFDVRKDPDPVKFYDFAKEYLQWTKGNKKPSTFVREKSFMRQLHKEFEQKTIQEITTWQIEKWKTKRKEEIKPASVNRELALLKNMYSKAIEWGRANENPAKKVKFLKGAVKRVRFLMPDEVQRLLSSCGDALRSMVNVAIHTGMRKGELWGLQRPQVNFEQGFITLFDTKNHERRDIPMNETVKTTLAALPKRGEYFFCDGNGKRPSYTKISYSFHAALEKAGIEDFHFHDLRHTFASNLVMAGEDLNTVAELLGHKGLEMTRRYAHLSPKFKKRAVNVLDRIMSQIPSQSEVTEKVVVSLRP